MITRFDEAENETPHDQNEDDIDDLPNDVDYNDVDYDDGDDDDDDGECRKW